MAAYYADSSALVKRHLQEAGSPWTKALLSPQAQNFIITARISLAEAYSAFNRRMRKTMLVLADYQQIVADLNIIWASEYEIIEVTQPLIDDSRLMLEQHPLRAYDAVQLASAIQARRTLLAVGSAAPIFLSADDRLLVAAKAEGFATDNPNLH